MKTEEIKQLLEKYYSGESTLAEETILREFFNNDTVPEELIQDRAIFRYIADRSGIPEPSPDFEDEILSAVFSGQRKRNLYTIISGIAAALLITSGTYFFFTRENTVIDTYSDPEIAYTETMKILYEVSARMNKGTRPLEKVRMIESETTGSLQKIKESTSMINKQISPLGAALKAMKMTDDSTNQ